MATFTVRPEGIIRQPALTMPGNATGAEAACTSLTASQIRTLLSLGTADSPSFSGLTLSGDLLFNATNQYDIGNGTYDPRTVRAATSVLTPLVNNASAALTLGNSTYGVTVPGALTTSKPIEISGAPVSDVIGDFINTSADNVYLRARGPLKSYSFGTEPSNWFIYDNTLSAYVVKATTTGITSIGGVVWLAGTTSSFPSIRRSSTTAAFRLGDDSADAPISCAGITASGRITGSNGGPYTAILTGNASNAFIQTKLSGGYTYTFGTEATDRFIIFDQTGGGYKLIIAPTLMTVITPMLVTGSLTTTGTGPIRANGALCSGSSATNTALGVLDLLSANATGAAVIWSEAGVANRGAFGFAAASSTLSYRAGGTSMTTGIEVFTIGSTGNVGCAGITASGNVSYAQGLSTGTVTKSANYTTTADDYCVNVTANSIDITFETAVGCANREHEVINSGAGTVTLKTTSAQTISGSASGALTLAQWKSIRVKSDGANWLIMSQIT